MVSIGTSISKTKRRDTRTTSLNTSAWPTSIVVPKARVICHLHLRKSDVEEMSHHMMMLTALLTAMKIGRMLPRFSIGTTKIARIPIATNQRVQRLLAHRSATSPISFAKICRKEATGEAQYPEAMTILDFSSIMTKREFLPDLDHMAIVADAANFL